MQFKNLAALVALVAISNAAAIPSDLNERAELYGCASNTKRDIFGRCPGAPVKREPEPAELYACASTVGIGKRDKRCPSLPEKREPEPAELYACASTVGIGKRNKRCPPFPETS